MAEYTHGFRIETESCNGCLACMRACPTHALRIRNGVVKLLPELCIDCGSCLRVCPTGGIVPLTRSLAEFSGFKFRVAVVSPVLYGQFPVGVSPAHIVAGLKALGLDAVWDYAVEIEVVRRAIAEQVQKWEGRYLMVSVSCPVIVRLIQVAYPRMVDCLIGIQPPREVAGRALKRRYSRELGIREDEIAAIYITSCQAKTISILQPAEGGRSHLDGALGVSDIYNGTLAAAREWELTGREPAAEDLVRNASMLRWSTPDGPGGTFPGRRHLYVTGITNVIRVFDDIEKGKLRNLEFLECYACWGGCIGGNLAVDNYYVTRNKMQHLMNGLPELDPVTQAEADRRYREEDLTLEGPVLPRVIEPSGRDLRERVRVMTMAEQIRARLPGLDCGLCGAPSCTTLAGDVAAGEAAQTDCVFLGKERLGDLRELYLGNRS